MKHRQSWVAAAVSTILLTVAATAAGNAASLAPRKADPTPTPGPYAGMQQRPIKALSAEQQQGLTEGKGLGYARAAELNGYPGPMHATELADQLGLSPEQAQSARALMAAVFAESVPLGQRLVALEAELDRRFATGDLDEAEMRRLTAEIATVEGQYRAAHLAAHLKLRAILTPEQVARYNQLRGYDAPGGQPGHQHSH